MTEPVPRIVTDDNVGQVDATAVPRYGGEATFARLPRLDEVPQADVAVLGIPFDSGVSLTSRELLATLRSFATLNLVGADIVEVAPAYDHAQITGIAAAHVGYEILSAFAARS